MRRAHNHDTGARPSMVKSVLVGALLLHWSTLSPALDLPPGFAAVEVLSGLKDTSGIEFSPDGRMFICERIEGRLLVAHRNAALSEWIVNSEPFYGFDTPKDSNGNPDGHRSSGLRDIAFDPGFEQNGFVYAFYMKDQPRHNRVVRITSAPGNPDVAQPGSEILLLDLPFNNSTSSGSHNGGGITFGTDGRLYIATGDGWNGGDAVQSVSTFTGKLLRINSDGSLPPDNPFYGQANGSYRAIYALGLRNPFSISRHPETGEIFVNDCNGANKGNLLRVFPGANYKHQGFNGIGVEAAPWANAGNAGGKLVTGGTWYPADGGFPSAYHGSYFTALWGGNSDAVGCISRIESVEDPVTSPFATNVTVQDCGNTTPLKPVTTRVGPDGNLYFATTSYRANCGRVSMIRWTAQDAVDTPVISPAGGWSPAPVEVTLSTNTPGAKIRYTLDGTEPTPRSPTYVEPLVIGESLVVKARAFLAGWTSSDASEATFLVGTLRAPDNPDGAVRGLKFRTFEGNWTTLPCFDILTPTAVGTVDRFDLSVSSISEGYGLRFRGYVDVPGDGIYTFYLSSDDGSRLVIGDLPVVEEAVGAGSRERSGRIGLLAGRHRILVDYFQATRDAILTVSLEGPATPKQEIPAHLLHRDPNLRPVAVAGEDQVVPEHTLVELNGSGSSDPDSDGLFLTWKWRQLGGPPAELQGDDDAVTFFLADTVGNYVFELTVSDEESSDADTVVISVTELVGRWTFDETGGPVATDAMGGHDGVLLNGPVWHPADGVLDGALEFDGVDDAVVIDDLDVAGGNGLSIAFWFRGDDFDQHDARFVSKATGTGGEDHFWMVSTVKGSALRFRLKTDGATTTLASATGVIAPAEWIHVVAWYDGSSMRIYRNGTIIANTPKSGTIDRNPAVQTALGNQPPTAGSRPFDGLIDDVRIYNRPLSADEILTLVECTPTYDCNTNGIADRCDIASGASTDCNQNNSPDECDISSGSSKDEDQDGVPDECVGPPFLRADTDGDGLHTLNDAVALLRYLFAHSPTACEDAHDVDDNGLVTIGDGLDLLRFLFLTGSPPSAPFARCGVDPSPADPLGCQESACP